MSRPIRVALALGLSLSPLFAAAGCSSTLDLGSGALPASDGGPDSDAAAPVDGSAPADQFSFGAPEVHDAATVPLRDLWGAAPDDIYAVGDYGTVVHFDGTSWSRIELTLIEDFKRVSGCGPADVWIMSSDSIVHFSGAGWYEENPPRQYDSDSFEAVVCVPGDGAWVVAFNDAYHYVDGRWSEGYELSNVPHYAWAGGPSDVWFVSEFESSQDRWNGWSLTQFEIGQRLFWESVHGSSSNDVWVVSDEGGEMVAVHYDGSRFTAHPTSEMPGARDVLALGADSAFVVGLFGTVAEWDGTAWRAVRAMQYEMPTLNAVWGTRAGPLWVAADSGQLLRLR